MSSPADDDLVSLYLLAQGWDTYPDLLEGLCRWYGCQVIRKGRARMVRKGDVRDLREWLTIWRARPKLSRPKRRKPKTLG